VNKTRQCASGLIVLENLALDAGGSKAYSDEAEKTPKTTAYAYDDNGNRASVTYPGGQREEYEYYDDNLLMTLTNRESGGSVYDTYYYEYDAAHNQTRKVDAKGETLYGYDALNRLAGVTEPDGKLTEYEYDAAGNRTLEKVTVGEDVTSTAYTYNEQNRLLTTVQVVGLETRTTAYTYDNNGNLTYKADEITRKIDPANPPTPHFGMFISGQADDPATPQNDAATEYAVDMLMSTAYYTYDGFNQLSQSTQGNSTIAYRYNGEGLRVEKTVNDEATRYVYNDAGQVILETTARGITTARNVYGTNLLARIADGQTAYYFYNGHADVVALFGETDSILATYYYDAFGNITEEAGTFDNQFRYAGYQYDSETKLYYLQSRMYDPALARFLQEDSFRGRMNDPLSLNLYTYCHNNPIMYWDPTGFDLVPLRKNVEEAGGTVTYDDRTGDAKFTVGNYTVTVNVEDDGVTMIDGHMYIDEDDYGVAFGLNPTRTVKPKKPSNPGKSGGSKDPGSGKDGDESGGGSGGDGDGTKPVTNPAKPVEAIDEITGPVVVPEPNGIPYHDGRQSDPQEQDNTDNTYLAGYTVVIQKVVRISKSYYWVADDEGNYGILIVNGRGIGTEVLPQPHLAYGASFGKTNAKTIFELKDWGASTGGSASIPSLTVGWDYVTNIECDWEGNMITIGGSGLAQWEIHSEINKATLIYLGNQYTNIDMRDESEKYIP